MHPTLAGGGTSVSLLGEASGTRDGGAGSAAWALAAPGAWDGRWRAEFSCRRRGKRGRLVGVCMCVCLWPGGRGVEQWTTNPTYAPVCPGRLHNLRMGSRCWRLDLAAVLRASHCTLPRSWCALAGNVQRTRGEGRLLDSDERGRGLDACAIDKYLGYMTWDTCHALHIPHLISLGEMRKYIHIVVVDIDMCVYYIYFVFLFNTYLYLCVSII